MSRARKYFVLITLVIAWCGPLHSQVVARQAAVRGFRPGRTVQKQPEVSNPISAAQKQEFIHLLETLPREGEFYTEEAVKQAGPYLAVLFALTEKDIEMYDFYIFGAISRG